VYDEIQRTNKEAITAPQRELPRLPGSQKEKNKQSQHKPNQLTAV
jgi:hypothetical protein